ncbi:2OG-Fe(II) oxygenase [Cyanobacterium sp. Dongsha4]|uniref:2OG-Fe(II) oxygenase n=1 Tax=Cyanobacterium sp. DS4 TaxID=2878255 RepID=UPI002E7FCC0A|nr:2OG-Fe(II) oxygenase [Cyanobacterium sp. Dongsha4]WVL01345.1 2OG-Fe(II) oxygenase [Cyanobacterium sp. Dongsha4]
MCKKEITKYYAQRTNLFSLNYLDELEKSILSSPYLADNQLSDNFAQTRGFSVVFKRESIDKVEQEFPFFKNYLQMALKNPCNAFYLNALILDDGSRVEPHIDCSISSYERIMLVPQLVSVLYVKIPDDLQGGELILELENKPVGKITPRRNNLIYFIGHLLHSVNPVVSSQPRISLICEQYNLPDERLVKIPDLDIQSNKK